MAKLEGVVYQDDNHYIEIKATVFNDRGRNSAESKWGADFAITASISDSKKTIDKAILVQAKMNVSDLKSTSLFEQINKMKKITKSPKVMILNPIDENLRDPFICSGNKILENNGFSKQRLSTYFTTRILTTFDGDTRKQFVENVQDSTLTRIHLIAKTK